MNKHRLLLVHNADVPGEGALCAHLRQSGQIELGVYYLASHVDADVETGCKLSWDEADDRSYLLSEKGAVPPISSSVALRRMLEFAPDLAIIGGYSSLRHLRIASCLKRHHVAIGVRTDATVRHRGEDAWWWRLGRRLVLRHVFRSFDTWHPMGSLAKEYLHFHAGNVRPCFFFPYPVDNAWLHALAEKYRRERAKLRAELGITENDFVVLGVLKWCPREDPMTLLCACGLAQRRNSKMRLIMVGDGPQKTEVVEYANANKIRAVLPGYVHYSQLPLYYAISDIFVHPARNEPWGMSVNEAMACGIPAVVSDWVGSGADLVVEGTTGWVFPRGRSDFLGNLLADLSIQPEKVRHAGEMAYDHVQDWGYSLTVSETLRALGYVREMKAQKA